MYEDDLNKAEKFYGFSRIYIYIYISKYGNKSNSMKKIEKIFQI